MTNEEILEKIFEEKCKNCKCDCGICEYDFARNKAIEMYELKDEQPISELNGWHTEKPTEDGWYLIDTPDFPKNCHLVVAEWDNDAKHFYSEASDFPIEFCKWKLIEKR